MRREIEILVCCALILIICFEGAAEEGEPGRYEESLLYEIYGKFWFFGLHLLGFATIMTIAKSDLKFRIILYPLSLIIGFALLCNIKSSSGYGWNSLWQSLPFGVLITLLAAGWIYILNGAIPSFLWSKSNIWQNMRRSIEIFVCYAFVLFMWISATAPPGSSMAYEQGFVYFTFSPLLAVFATIMTIPKRDLWFRIVLYPFSLFFGFALLGIIGFALLCNIKSVYGCIWGSILALLFGVPIALLAAGWIYIFNGAIPSLWSKFKNRFKTKN